MNINHKNPVGTNGFAFVEFASPNPKHLANDFVNMGFTKVAMHKEKKIDLYRQGEINFLLNYHKDSQAMAFINMHGSGATSMGFRVKNAEEAKDHALKLGALPYSKQEVLDLPCIQGVGDSLIYFITDDEFDAFYQNQFDFFENENSKPAGKGLTYIDHLTHNVKQGQMDVWAGFYERIFNFKEIRYFNIKGKMTGLLSRAMSSPCGKIRIPINESSDNKSQIQEFIEEFSGEGIQHIALGTGNIYHSIASMRESGIKFLETPDVYFDMIKDRLPWQMEDITKLRELQILIDGEKTPQGGLLLQIFTENMLGPVFFEIIQRKGNEGFGEGNFQALFEAIELDQIKRGKLNA